MDVLHCETHGTCMDAGHGQQAAAMLLFRQPCGTDTQLTASAHVSTVWLSLQVLSDAVPVDPDQIEALVGAAAGNARMSAATAGSNSSFDEPAAVLSAAA
jgi:hypothetical protein